MNLSELEDRITQTLTSLKVGHRKFTAVRGISTHFVIEDFGLIVCCINRADYSQASDTLNDQFKDYRFTFVTTNDDMMETKYRILWDLMRGGYMKWLRYTHPRQVKNVLNGPENLGQRIINERLRIWADKPKYKFLIEDNRAVLRAGIVRELTNDPGFFDFMPGE